MNGRAILNCIPHHSSEITSSFVDLHVCYHLTFVLFAFKATHVITAVAKDSHGCSYSGNFMCPVFCYNST